jgi:hypothetical protein
VALHGKGVVGTENVTFARKSVGQSAKSVAAGKNLKRKKHFQPNAGILLKQTQAK